MCDREVEANLRSSSAVTAGAESASRDSKRCRSASVRCSSAARAAFVASARRLNARSASVAFASRSAWLPANSFSVFGSPPRVSARRNGSQLGPSSCAGLACPPSAVPPPSTSILTPTSGAAPFSCSGTANFSRALGRHQQTASP